MIAARGRRGSWVACGEILSTRKGYSETCLQQQHINSSHSVFSYVTFVQIASAFMQGQLILKPNLLRYWSLSERPTVYTKAGDAAEDLKE